MAEPAPLLVTPGGRVLDLVRHRTGRDVLLEAGDGELVDYSVATTAAPVVVRAVLSRDLSPLRASSGRQRALGVVPGGAVIACHLAPQLVGVVVPVCGPGDRAWMWLVGPDDDVDVATAQELSAVVAAHSPDVWETEDVEALVDGRATLPASWAGEPTS